jgi:hypothetical protein
MKTQIGEEVRDMTAEEIAAHELATQDTIAAAQQTANKEQARRDALAKLGLTEQEIDAIIG